MIGDKPDRSMLPSVSPIIAFMAVTPDPSVDVELAHLTPEGAGEPGVHGTLFMPSDCAYWVDQLAHRQVVGRGGPRFSTSLQPC